MQTKRAIVIAGSLLLGAVITYLVIFIGFGVDLEVFGYDFSGMLYISFACVVGIWLDYFLDTQFLKH